MPAVEGLPEGATVTPIPQVEGLPEGATVTPIGNPPNAFQRAGDIALRTLQGAGRSMQSMMTTPLGVGASNLPPVDISNPPTIKLDMPKSLSDFAGRFFGPMGKDISNFGKGLTDYEDWHSGNYAGAVGNVAMNLLGMAAVPRGEPQNPYATARSVSGAEGKYSPAGNALASQLPAVQGSDMPAVAHSAIPLIRESAADLGLSEAAWMRSNKMNGPAFAKAAIDHAVDLQAQRVEPLLDQIRNTPVEPRLFQQTPELANHFEPGQPITYGMIDDLRKEANNQLTRGNYYMKPVSKQIAANEPTIDALKTAQQARFLEYKAAGDATGVDLRPLQAAESNLITLADAMNKAHDNLSRAQAIHESTPFYEKIPVSRMFLSQRGVGGVLSESASQAAKMFPPTNDFNRAMQTVFKDLEPERASVIVTGAQTPFVPRMTTALPSRPLTPPSPEYPALPAAGRSSSYFPQTNIAGTPSMFRPPTLQLGGGNAPVYAPPTTVGLPNLLSPRGVPATRLLPPLSIEETNR